MLNKSFIAGRLTRDPELKHTTTGTAVTSFTLACERDRKDQDGNKVTDFLDCVAWQKTAELVAKYCAKGRMVTVTGSLQTRKWTDKEGSSRTSFEIVADTVYFMDYAEKKRDGNQAPLPSGFSDSDTGDDELPF